LGLSFRIRAMFIVAITNRIVSRVAWLLTKPSNFVPFAQNQEVGQLSPSTALISCAGGVDDPLIGSPSIAVATYVGAILLACEKGLFLTVTPIRRKKRLIVEVSACTPRSAERRSHRA
jgi:hypothetical protein